MSRVWAFLMGSLVHGRVSLMWSNVACFRNCSCCPRVYWLWVRPWVCYLASWTLTMGRPHRWSLDVQHSVFFSQPCCLLEESLHLSLACQLSYLNGLAPFKIIFLFPNRRVASKRFGHLCRWLNQQTSHETAPMLRPCVLMIHVAAKWTHTFN